MTRNEVLAMKPGRELDALVAEKVMGLEYIPASSPSAGLIVQDHFFDPKTGDALFGWSPSTNIAAAWEVEEEINKRNLRVAYCQALQIVIRSQKDYVTTFDYVHASPADRCKAALLAVMEE
jgi:hypothetical protein